MQYRPSIELLKNIVTRWPRARSGQPPFDDIRLTSSRSTPGAAARGPTNAGTHLRTGPQIDQGLQVLGVLFTGS
jgi:hypothetical protein